VSEAPGRIKKSTLFISHAVTDEPIAAIVKAEIDRVFARGVNVFASSIPGTVKPGSDWLRAIRKNLDDASAVAVLITPVSINRPWIWFEVGASVFTGKLIHYREVDQLHLLPPGTAKRFVIPIAGTRYDTFPVYEAENSVRLQFIEPDDDE